MKTNIEKSFYCLGSSNDNCFNCSYCRAIDSCNDKTHYDLLPTEINPLFNDVPVAINLFYGDPLIQMDKTLNYLYRLEKAGHKGIVTIITKGDFAKFPDIPFNLDLHIAFSTFGKNHKYDGGSWERFANNLKQISQRNNNYKYSIEFRPICYGINDDEETIIRVLDKAAEYNLCVGYCGLQGKPDVVRYWKDNNIKLSPYPDYEFGHKKPISVDVENRIRRLAQEKGVTLFSKTSCLLSYIHNKDRDYNAHYYRPDEVKCNLCPMNERCTKFKEKFSPIVSLPFKYMVKKEHNYECVLCKTGKCNYPTEECKHLNGVVLHTNEPLTIADYRMIKWLTGYIIDTDFEHDQRLSDFWIKPEFY